MVRTPSEIKNILTTWLNEANIQFDDVTLNETQAKDIEFTLITKGKLRVNIYILKKLPDRIIVQGELGLAQEHKDMVSKLESPKKNALLLNLTNTITVYNIRYRFLLDGSDFNGIRLHLFNHDNDITKTWLIESYVRIQEVTNNILNTINIGLGRPPQQPTTSNDEDSLPYG